MKDLMIAKKILGMQISRNLGADVISQVKEIHREDPL